MRATSKTFSLWGVPGGGHSKSNALLNRAAAWCTNYILAILDSLLKNIGEAVAVLVIYFMQVPQGHLH